MDIKKVLKEKRPNLSDSSVRTYASILTTLYKRVFPDSDFDVDKFNDAGKILDYLKEMAAPKRKTLLSALVVISGGNEKYRNQMIHDIGSYNDGIAQQEKSPAQEESWLTTEDIKKRWDILRSQTAMLYKYPEKNASVMQQIQNFVLLSVLGGIFTPPRRSLDWCAFKINHINPASDNYYDTKTKEFVFSTYKTAKTYGQQRVACPPELRKILTKFIALNPHRDFLFFDSNGAPLTSIKLNQRFSQIFGKKASVNQMRHSYLTNKFGDTIKQNQLIAETMKEMGSSPAQLNLYVKRDSRPVSPISPISAPSP
jgi:hypothetical protein